MKTSIFLFSVALALFTLGLSAQEVVNFDARFYLFAKEMWRNGVSWFPTTYDRPYPDYTALSTFLIYIASKLFGGLSKFTAVLPSALAAALTVVVTYHIGKLQDRRLGLYAVCLLFSTVAFFKSARAIALDMYPTLITALCFYLVHSAAIKHQPSRTKWIYPLFVLSFAFRGPIGLVMPTGVVSIYYLMTGRLRQFLLTGIIASILLMISIGILLLLAYQAGGETFVQDVWRMEVAGRLGHYFQPFYFYFTDGLVSYAVSYPIALFVMIGVIFIYQKKTSRTESVQFIMLLTGWALVILLGMSIPSEKKIRYVLPMAPAIALIAASLLASVPKQKYLAGLRRVVVCSLMILPALLCAATAYASYIAPRYGLANVFPFLSLMIFFAVMQMGSLYNYFADQDAGRGLDSILIFATACVAAVNLWLVEPIELYVDRTRDFVLSVEKQRHQKNARLVFYHENSDEMPIKYIINMVNEERPIYVDDAAGLSLLDKSDIIITSTEFFETLPPSIRKLYRVIGDGRIGHVKVVVFEYGK